VSDRLPDPGMAAFLEEIHGSCTVASRLRRDPLAIVASFPELRDREVVGLVASTLAFGSVDLILRACRQALAPLGDSPCASLLGMDEAAVEEAWADFQYRYCFSKDITALMLAARRAILEAGSLESFFALGDDGGQTVVEATGSFAQRLKALSLGRGGRIRDNLLPETAKGSACKRLFLFLRWMVRRDAVDPGGWTRVDRSRLIVPMDTHMARVCSDRLHFLPSPRADLKAALEATAWFRLYAPLDPVKYDFALTRPGIDPEPGDERFACG
jgi:uncharacterized protein (TIGR02757 family)